MGNFKVKYTSEVHLDRDWAFAPGHWFKMDWDKLETKFPDPDCYLVALDTKQLNLLHHLVSIFPKYYRNWGYEKASLDNAVWDDVQGWISELELCLMSGCKVSDLYGSIERLTAVVAGETFETTDSEGQPVTLDYSNSGLIPTLRDLFSTSEELFYDSRNVAEILSVGLIGRKLDLLPLPWEGTGLADIADDMLNQLQDRFVMRDSSLFNPLFDEKNIVEALETLLRRDIIGDIELSPNVATILQKSLNLGAVDTSIISLLKSVVRVLAIQGVFPESISNWLSGQLDEEKQLSIAQLMLLLIQALQKLQSTTAKIDASTIVNILNNNNCDGQSTQNGNGAISKITLTDEGVSVEGEPPLLEGGG